ncbi:MAG: TonB-dependent receptor, partial [Candidatus Marinimicrobia bacterium]|nr:TonB-dependent receptor [Candidatus Neomarinimicrobiota bacterium]
MQSIQYNLSRLIIVILVLLFTLPAAFAGRTGKISGRIMDAQTGNPLPGVNITLKGTFLGASTDSEGYYYILQIPPGSYTAVASYIGFKTVSVEEIWVSTNLTTSLSFDLEPTVLEISEEIVVVAVRPMVIKDQTSSVHHMSAEEIMDLPGIGEIEDVIALQPGVVGDGENINVRGGRSGEILYLLDGIPINDPVYNTETLDVGRYAISEVEFQTGGFNAEYGGSQSAIVNIVTKTGGRRFTGRVAYFTDDFGSGEYVGYQLGDEYFVKGVSNFIEGVESDTLFNGKTEGRGLRKYSFNTDRMEINSGGPEPITTYLLPSLGVNLPGEGISYYVSLQTNFSDGYTRVPGENYDELERLPDGFTESGFDADGIPLGEYYIDTLATGDNPNIARYENEVSRNVDHPFRRNLFGIDFGSRYSNRVNGSANIDWRLSPTHRLALKYNISESWFDSYLHILKFVPDHSPQWDRESTNLSLVWNHSLSNKTFYTVSLSKFRNYELRYPGMKNGLKLLPTYLQEGDVPDDRVDDTPGSPTEGFYTKGYRQWLVYNEHENNIFTFKTDLESQVARHHEIKTGFEARYMDVDHQEIQYGNRVTTGQVTPGRWPERGIFRDFYHYFPTEGAIYLQDKIEYETLIVNAGLR